MHVHLAARYNEILLKTKTGVSYFLDVMFLNLCTANSYMSSQNTSRFSYKIE